MSLPVTRRLALGAAASLPLLSMGGVGAQAAVSLQGLDLNRSHRFRFGGFEITTLLAGTRALEKPHETFGLNVPAEEFERVSTAAFLPSDRSQNFFTPTLVNTAQELVLFDTGLNGAGIAEALAQAGLTTDAITVVVLTHMHGDHIGGLTDPAGSPTFRNARYIAGRIEYEHWEAQANEGFNKQVKPLRDKMELIEDGASPVAGLTAILAPGHTPGHMVWQVESEGQKLILTADLANHYIWSVGHPDWEVRFDADKPKAAESRRKILGMIAEQRLPFIGYHMPFPAVGYLTAEGEGFRYVPASYQFLVGQ